MLSDIEPMISCFTGQFYAARVNEIITDNAAEVP